MYHIHDSRKTNKNACAPNSQCSVYFTITILLVSMVMDVDIGVLIIALELSSCYKDDHRLTFECISVHI